MGLGLAAVSYDSHIEYGGTMLAEWNKPGVLEGKLTKRWFGDAYFDLFVWLDETNTIVSFQLCYGKPLDEHALTWMSPSIYYHQRVDDGENKPGKSKSTPILLPDGMFEVSSIARRFLEESKEIDKTVSKFIHQRILDFNKTPASA
jgi:hypothetical protein